MQATPDLRLALALLTALGAAAAPAQERLGKFEVGMAAGVERFDSARRLDVAPMLGISAAHHFTERWAVEVYLLEADAESRRGDRDVDLQHLWLGLLYHLRPVSRLTPYLAGGFGNLHQQPELEDSTDLPGVNFGGGAKYLVNQGLALRADLRAVHGENGENDLAATLGLTLLFGGPEAAAPRDSDGDGVADGRDRCPGTPAGAPVDGIGCPSAGSGPR